MLNNKHGRNATPLDEKTRFLFEVAIISHLRLKAEQKKGAYSEELLDNLKKHGYFAVHSLKQVAMICRGLRTRHILVSKQVRLQGKVSSDLKRKTYWLINPDFFTAYPKWGVNPDFYKKHPGGAFTTRLSFEEIEKAMKQRTKPKKKAKKGQARLSKKDNAGFA